ncbi:MAG: outer membrane protein transport protein [Alphaproteobacteria bacterium]|nr:outer membrane protein transport protein [Alphaproteobacteria bacterium]
MKKVSMLAVAFMLSANGAMAGGFSLSEYSTTSLGRGFAGMGLVGDDYSAIISNPAGMTLVKDGMQIGASFVDIYAKIDDELDSSNSDSLNIFSSVPSFFVQTSLTDKLKGGLAFYTPYGIGTNYDKTWWGRDEALKSEIIVYDFTLSGAYELTNKLSLGASLSTQMATAHLTNDKTLDLTALGYGKFEHILHSDIKGDNGDDLTFAYTLGAMYQLDDNNRYGLSYRSKSKYDLEGTHKLTSNIDIPAAYASLLGATTAIPEGTVVRSGKAHATVVLPENIMASSYHKIDDRLALSATAKWTRWSRFKELNIYSDANGVDALVSSTQENWRDTWTFSVGADYDYSKDWTFRVGLEVEQTPIPSDAHRTARIPDDDRRIAALGASYKFNGGKVDFAYAHIFLDGGNAKYSETNPNGFNTEYDLHINMLSAAVQYYF